MRRSMFKRKPMQNKLPSAEPDDIVIAVMGPTGTGKSTFIRSASGLDTQGVGNTLKSFTSQVLPIRFWDEKSRRHIVLVDTPGFDDTYKSDFDTLKMISNWLTNSYDSDKLLSAILYFHRITDNRMAGTPLRNLRLFEKLCGKEALETVYLTTTMWDEVDSDVGERRLTELKKYYWKELISHRAQTVRCGIDNESPKKLLRQIVEQETARRAVLLQKEMREMKKELKETAAGQLLFSQLESLVEKQLELLQRIDKERKAAAESARAMGMKKVALEENGRTTNEERKSDPEAKGHPMNKEGKGTNEEGQPALEDNGHATDKKGKEAFEENLLEELEREYDELRAQIDVKLGQMQELKLSWFTRHLGRFFPRR